jgi:hypothetical protein
LHEQKEKKREIVKKGKDKKKTNLKSRKEIVQLHSKPATAQIVMEKENGNR